MKEKVRYISADLLRGLVIIIMIEVHVFNAFLLPELRQTGWFGVLNFINGLVAPSFLFVSGFAFQVSSGSKLNEMRKLGITFWKKIGRIFQIIIIGYGLHLPFFSLSKIKNELTPQLVESFFAVDVLQCIGFGLLFLFLTRLLIKSDKTYHYLLIASIVVATLISPFLWKIDFANYLPLVIANYFNRMHGSLFPIFPWVSFLLAGAVFAKYFVDARENNVEEKFIKISAGVGFVLLLLGHLFLSGLSPEAITSILPNPIFYLQRLGYIFVLFYLCWWIDKKIEVKKSFVLDASKESLLVYWFHLVIIFGAFWGGKSFADNIGKTMSLFEAIGASVLLIILVIVAAKLWGWLKKSNPKYASVGVRVFVAVLLIVFIFS
jgi:uncharacterized membrane protein